MTPPPLSPSRRAMLRNDPSSGSAPAGSATPTLFCICRKPYDDKKFYIQCDSCDEWFHGSCMRVSEKESEAIDKWYCKHCRNTKGLTVQFRPACARRECPGLFARVGSLYCSDECGVEDASRMLKSGQVTFRPKRLRPKPPSDSESEQICTQSITRRTLHMYESKRRKLTTLIQQIKLLVRALESRQLRIDDAVDRSNRLNADVMMTAVNAGVPLITASRGIDRVSANRICSFDSRIVGKWSVDLYPQSMAGKTLQDVLLTPDPWPQDPDPSAATTVPAATTATTASENVHIKTETTNDTITNANQVKDEPDKNTDSTTASMVLPAELSRYYLPTLCLHRGRCPRHDGWDFSKPREVELEIAEQISTLNIRLSSFMYYSNGNVR
eukprot:jgi/Hompol1/2632/HPOL_001040-RA